MEGMAFSNFHIVYVLHCGASPMPKTAFHMDWQLIRDLIVTIIFLIVYAVW